MDARLTWRPWIVLLAAVVLLYAGLSWRNRDENRISRRLEHLSKVFAKAPGESSLSSLRRAQEIAAAFTAQPEVRLGPYLPDLFNRQDLAAAVHHARALMDEIRASIRDKTTRVAEDRRSATTDLAVEGVFVYQGQGDRKITECRIQWVKEDGQWLIQAFEPQEVIKPPRRLRTQAPP